MVRGTVVPPVQPGEAEFLRAALAALPPEPLGRRDLGRLDRRAEGGTGRKGKALFLPLRLALTGEDHGPDLKTLLPLIGREKAAQRLRLGADG